MVQGSRSQKCFSHERGAVSDCRPVVQEELGLRPAARDPDRSVSESLVGERTLLSVACSRRKWDNLARVLRTEAECFVYRAYHRPDSSRRMRTWLREQPGNSLTVHATASLSARATVAWGRLCNWLHAAQVCLSWSSTVYQSRSAPVLQHQHAVIRVPTGTAGSSST